LTQDFNLIISFDFESLEKHSHSHQKPMPWSLARQPKCVNSNFHAQGKYWLSKMESYRVLVLLFSCYKIDKRLSGLNAWNLESKIANMKSCQSKKIKNN